MMAFPGQKSNRRGCKAGRPSTSKYLATRGHTTLPLSSPCEQPDPLGARGSAPYGGAGIVLVSPADSGRSLALTRQSRHSCYASQPFAGPHSGWRSPRTPDDGGSCKSSAWHLILGYGKSYRTPFAVWPFEFFRPWLNFFVRELLPNSAGLNPALRHLEAIIHEKNRVSHTGDPFTPTTSLACEPITSGSPSGSRNNSAHESEPEKDRTPPPLNPYPAPVPP
jgi:hypothetical protein